MPISNKRLADAIKAIGLTIPIRNAYEREDGVIVLVTRNGEHPYKPPVKTKRRVARKPKSPPS